MKTKHEKTEYCAITEATKIIGDTWNILIIRQLMDGCKRFGELEEKVTSITSSTLSDRLKKLIDEDIVFRNQYECIPPKVEYSLTDKGKALLKVIKEIERFADAHYSI